MVVHLVSLWKWEFLELGNGLLILISDQARDLVVKICFEGRPLWVPFKTARLHQGSWINRLRQFTCDDLCAESENYWATVIWWHFARIKCGNIVSGWLWIVLSLSRTWLIVWFSEVMTDRFQVCRGARAIKILRTSKNASWVFSWSDFVLANRFRAQER